MLRPASPRHVLPRIESQHGFVLVTCLLIISMLTVLAVGAFKTSYMQTLIAGNMRFQTLSFNSAERSLREAETQIENKIAVAGFFDFGITGDGYYNNGENIDVRAIDWDTISGVEAGAQADDKYVIQYYGRQQIPGSDEAASGSSGSVIGSYVYTYIVTARSLNAKRAERVVQSVYVTLEQP